MLDMWLKQKRWQKIVRLSSHLTLLLLQREYQRITLKKLILYPNDFSYATYIKLSEDLKTKFISKPNFSKRKEL